MATVTLRPESPSAPFSRPPSGRPLPKAYRGATIPLRAGHGLWGTFWLKLTDVETIGGLRADRSYSSFEVCELTGVTYRQLDQWARKGMAPALEPGDGQGSVRRWSADDVVYVFVVARLLAAGMSHDWIRRNTSGDTGLRARTMTALARIRKDSPCSTSSPSSSP